MALGNIFIALVADDEAFDPVAHARNDFDLVDARPRWAENDFWSIECDIANADGGVFRPDGRTRIFISEEVDGQVLLAFVGRIEGWPIGPAGKTVTLTIMCKPATVLDANGAVVTSAETVEIAALAAINDDPWSLFSDPIDKRTSDIVLAARSALLHWGRDDAAPVVVDLLQGDGLIDIGSKFIDGSLELEQPTQPIGRVDVTVKAEWLQSLPLVINLAQALGDDGYFGTISSPDWGDFPKPGEKIGDWEVIRSAVSPRNPPAGVDEFSRVFTGHAEENRKLTAGPTQDQEVSFRRLFFDIDLVAVSVLSANRRETLTFSLEWSGQEITGYQGTTETVELECRNMSRDDQTPDWVSGVPVNQGQDVRFDGAKWRCTQAHVTGASLYADFDKWDVLLFDFSPSGGQVPSLFFGAPETLASTTPAGNYQEIYRSPTPGWRAINYAMQQARAKMISGVRIVRASFEVPWEDVRTITGRERIRIADPAIPGGEMTGKVVSVDAELIRGVAKITIAAAPGKGGIEPNFVTPVYPVPGLFTQGIISSAIVNDYQAQEQALAQYEVPAQYDLVEVSKSLATRFEISLSPTSGTSDLDVAINMGTFPFDTEAMVELTA